jgi:hypothetical protein
MKIQYATSAMTLVTLETPDIKNSRRFPDFMLPSMEELISRAKSVGYDRVQLLTLRRTTGLESDVIAFEDAWRPEIRSVLDVKFSRLVDDLIQLFFFAPWQEREAILSRLRERSISEISHLESEAIQNGERFGGIIQYVELHHFMGVDSIEKLRSRCLAEWYRLVPDTRHLLRKKPENSFLGNSFEEALAAVEQLADLFAPIVHLQPMGDFSAFLDKPEETETGKLFIEIIKQMKISGPYTYPEIVVVLEYHPGIKGLLSSVKSLALSERMLSSAKRLIALT